MLDGLVAEARQRWGLDPGAGLQVVPAERLVAFPIEASRPLLIVPLEALGARLSDDAAAEPVPGRHGPAGRDPLALLRRLYPAAHPVHSESGDVTVGALAAGDLARPFYVPPLAPELAAAGP